MTDFEREDMAVIGDTWARAPLHGRWRIFVISCRGLALVLAGLALAISVTPVAAAEPSDFESFQKQRAEEVKDFQAQRSEEFRAYRRKILNAFAEYREKAAVVWGQDEAAVPGRKQWVSYRDAMRERRMVDFEQGKASFEIALEPGTTEVPESTRKRLIKAIVDSVSQGPDQRSITEIAREPDQAKPGGASILAGQLETATGEPVTEENAEEFARQTVRDNLRTSQVEGEDGKTRTVVSATIPMIPDHVRKRAERYEQLVNAQSQRQSLEPELVFAVIETESFFNPVARSPVPAFGLMQLVPVSGGRDAYRMVHGKDQAPSEELLYQPRANVELGTAYLHRLYFDYMAGIKNKQARLWCAVAAYNTGPGNLYKTFAPEGGKTAALHKINSMSSRAVFGYLVDHLPYKETQDYIRRVRDKMPKYQRL